MYKPESFERFESVVASHTKESFLRQLVKLRMRLIFPSRSVVSLDRLTAHAS